jgi:hypothetical protein
LAELHLAATLLSAAACLRGLFGETYAQCTTRKLFTAFTAGATSKFATTAFREDRSNELWGKCVFSAISSNNVKTFMS